MVNQCIWFGHCSRYWQQACSLRCWTVSWQWYWLAVGLGQTNSLWTIPSWSKWSPTYPWLLTWLSMLCFDAKSVNFTIDRTDVWFMHCNSKHRFHLLLWSSRGSSDWLHPAIPGTQTHTLLLLLIVEHLKHKLHRDSPFVQVLFWNSLTCSIQEA